MCQEQLVGCHIKDKCRLVVRGTSIFSGAIYFTRRLGEMGAFWAIQLLSHSLRKGEEVQLLVKLAEARSVGRTDVTEVPSVAGKA